MAKDRCRCCGKYAHPFFSYSYKENGRKKYVNIHTRCIVKHWNRHDRGVNASRCREFGGKK